MNKEFIKRNTEAHGWLGLIISALLFVVFFTGSISFFRHEIQQWAYQPHFQTSATEASNILSMEEVMEIAIAGQPFNARDHLAIYPPTEHTPYFLAYVDILENEEDLHYISLMIDPVTGEILGQPDGFFLAEFFYILHYSLNLPYGVYLIGFVTLFFLFAIFSGILIHAADTVKGFFRYRAKGRKRSQLLDLHNIVGVISLPYTLMFAITGLIFNLVIIYQIAFAVFVYQGDTNALLEDAGIVTITPQWQDQPWQENRINEIYEQQVQAWGATPTFVRVYNYGDESAVLEIYASDEGRFAGQHRAAIKLSDGSMIYNEGGENVNAVTSGVNVVAALHFGNFGGLDLRVIYFLLGAAVCALIVTGNMLWIGQREKTYSPGKLAFVARFTLASSAGLALASAVAFIAERLLPLGLADRSGWMVNSFILSLLATSIYIWFSRDRRLVLIRLMQITGGLCLALVMIDAVFFTNALSSSIQHGQMSMLGVNISLGIAAAICFYTASKVNSDRKAVASQSSDYLPSGGQA